MKTRTSLPTWLLAAMDQSIRDARPEWQPGVILNVVSRGRKARRLLVADLDSVLREDDDRRTLLSAARHVWSNSLRPMPSRGVPAVATAGSWSYFAVMNPSQSVRSVARDRAAPSSA